jgi:hypothetical protein
MAQLIHDCEHEVSRGGVVYRPRAWAEQRGNVWVGWLEFVPVGGGTALQTGEETSQPNLETAVYWAEGLEPVYLDGALARAK